MRFTSTRLIALLAAALLAAPLAAESITSEELALVKQAEEARIRAIESIYGSVVAVYGPARQGGGSGVVFDPAGYALTNHHVVAGAGAAGKAGLADGKLYDWKLIGTDPGGDVAIIKLEGKDAFPFSPLGNSDLVRVGDWAMAIGNPFVLAEDQKPTVTLGVVSGVKRYQYGAGKNTLVYGNCIQVDSSINPGNSGGPLYSMLGQVIGINGRGSFKERGRVNVGVGYAISMKQIRNFIPEIMSTRLVQHGTLDALFSNRKENEDSDKRVVLCDTINLDAPIAKMGLKLGDRLIAFEGEPIDDANQFTNLISTLPANWPVELTYERAGKQRTIWARLTPLPYGEEQIHPPAEEPMPDPKKEEPPKEGEKPAPMPIRIEIAKPNFGKEGEVRDAALNRSNAKYLLARTREYCGAAALGEAVQAFTLRDELRRKDKKIGEVESLIASDGRFRVIFTEYGVKYASGYDGKNYWSHLADKAPENVEADVVLEQPLAAQALALASMLRKEPLAELGDVTIDGADKAQRLPSYRLKLEKDGKARAYVWLRQFDDAGQTHLQLAKTCTDIDGADTAVLYSDWREVGGVWLPHTRSLATGLEETTAVQLTATEVKILEKVDDEALRSPVDAKE